ncbi:MAG TPA: hypothetical protein VN364_08265 [Bellilinea sp.]|nr:hypothetical protein [Bellilinea sp.]
MATKQHTLRCGNYLVAFRRCKRGQQLHNEWTRTIKAQKSREEIYQAMQDYFHHKNGIRSKNGQMAIAACSQCCMVVVDRVEEPRKS